MTFAAQRSGENRRSTGTPTGDTVKKIAIAAAAMGGTALIAFGASGTFAAFTDSEQATAAAGAGTLDLQVGGGTVSGDVEAFNLNPNESTTISYWVNNVGTVAGNLAAKLKVVQDAENGCNDPEREADDSCTEWSSGGEFSSFATVQFLDSDAANAVACEDATTGTPVLGMSAVRLQDAEAGLLRVGSLEKNAGNCVVLEVKLPDTATNAVQGDTAQVQLDITLTQRV
jgi:hypothetical protein